MDTEELKLLMQLRTACKENPDFIPKVVNACLQGVLDQNEVIRNHAVDMEIVANMAMNTRLFKGNESFIADKLEKWNKLGMNGLKWDDQIKKLRGE